MQINTHKNTHSYTKDHSPVQMKLGI